MSTNLIENNAKQAFIMNYTDQLCIIFYLIIRISYAVSGEKKDENIIDPEIKAKIDEFVQNVYLPNAGVTGLALSIVQNDDNGEQTLLYTAGYGMSDQESGIPNGNQTQFLIGSVTKSMTSVIAVKVLSEKFPEMGEAVLDTPISKLIPSVNFTLIDRFRSEHGTFRDLLSHRMCFLSDDLQMAVEPFNSTAEIVYRQRYSEEICGIRSGFQYNNQMYVVAGELVGILANRPYEDLVQDLLTEIGMLQSTLGKKTDDYSNLPFRAKPYYVMNNVSLPMNTELLKRLVDSNAAGGLWLTPNDMAKYASFHLNLGRVVEKQIVPSAVMKWLRTESMVAPVQFFKSSEDEIVINLLSYGLGLMLSTYDGWQLLQHNGYYATYQSQMSLFPSQNLGVFTSSNQGPLLFDQTILHSFIFETLHDSERAPQRISRLIAQETIKQAIKKKEDQSKSHNFLSEFAKHRKLMQNVSTIIGVYGSGSSGDAEILETSTGLYLSYGKWGHGWLETYESDNEEVINLKILWDTDIIQENYAAGDTEGLNYARVYNETLEFVGPGPEQMISYGKFKLGVSLDKLPPIPWYPESC